MVHSKCKRHTYEGGFTLPELIVVVGILTILLSVTVISLLTTHSKTSIAATVEVLVVDIKDQQNKSMAGDTMGTSSDQHFGIYFESNQYTLFHGPSYNSLDPSNFVVTLDNNVTFSNILFPSSQIVFTPGSGQINGFITNQDSITVQDVSGSEQKTIKLNRYGVVTQVN